MMNEFKVDWTQFEREIFIQADLQVVFKAWVKPAEIWRFFMTNLKAWLEHGVDLREVDPERAYASRAITL